MTDSIIISIDDVRKLKLEKEKELMYYKDHLEADLRLTTDIIKMIEDESIMTIDSSPE
jgi:hypothetical protein